MSLHSQCESRNQIPTSRWQAARSVSICHEAVTRLLHLRDARRGYPRPSIESNGADQLTRVIVWQLTLEQRDVPTMREELILSVNREWRRKRVFPLLPFFAAAAAATATRLEARGWRA